MGGKVLELYSEKLLRRGEARGEERGRKAGLAEGEARGKKAGLAEGEARGRTAGMLATLCSLVKKGLLSVADAAKELGVSEEAFKKMAML
jgi:flagellar biosynthesis/type III secretory pathway protein FliH